MRQSLHMVFTTMTVPPSAVGISLARNALLAEGLLAFMET